MPFTGSVFANVSGASNAAPGQIVQSAVWNNIHTDYSAAFNQVMAQMIAEISDRNILWMNGGFEVWQRSTVVVGAPSTSYTADRWYLTTLANQVSSISAQAGLSTRSQFCGRIQRTAAQTGTGAMVFGFPLDTDEIIRMRGQIMTLSMLLSAGANFSPTNGTLQVALYTGTGAAPAKLGAGYTGQVTVVSLSTNLTVGGAAVAVSATSSVVVPASATQAELQFTWTPTGTAGAADYWQVDDLQLECNLSSNTWVPTNFDRTPFPIMLQGCKRHYNKTFPYDALVEAGSTYTNCLIDRAEALSTIGIFWQYPVEMRGNPSFSKFNPVTATSSNWMNLDTNVTVSAGFVSFTANNTKGIFITGLTAGSVDAFFGIHIVASAGI